MKLRKLRHVLTALLSAGLLLGLTATVVAQDDNAAQEAKKGQAGVETYKIDPVHSNVLFRVKHFGAGYVFGEFLGEQGEIKFDPNNPENMKVNLTIPVESISTDNEKRDQHLKSPDFFNAKQFPNITFESTKVEKRTDDTYEVTGDLTIRGKTKEVTTLVQEVGAGEDPQGNYRRGFYTTFNINRSDFGVDYMTGGVSDNVKLIFAVEGIRQ